MDWRFLVPTPREDGYGDLLLIGATTDLHEAVRVLGVARSVRDGADGTHHADTVVVLNGAPAAIDSLARRVRSGGVLYVEGHRTSALRGSSARHVERVIEREGLRVIASWGVRPGYTAERRAYLPLDVPSAWQWYLTSFRRATTARASARELAARALLEAGGSRVASRTRAFAILAGRDTRISLPPVLADPSIGALVGGPGVRTLLLTHGGDRVVLLPFRPGDPQPRAVVKIPRTPAFNGRTANEQRTLRNLRRRYGWLRDSVPAPLGLIRCGTVDVGVETYVDGRSLGRSTRHWARPRYAKDADLQTAAQWLTDFQCRCGIGRSPWGDADLGRWLEGPFQAFAREFGVTSGENHLFARTVDRARALVGQQLPLVWQHRDFKPAHVFHSGRTLRVIDWEGAAPGLPLCDLLHFVLHWYPAAESISRSDGLSQLLVARPAELGRAGGVKEAIATYVKTLEFDRKFIPILLVYTCVELALRRADQQRLHGDRGGEPRASNSAFELIDVLVKHTRELFGRDPRHALAG